MSEKDLNANVGNAAETAGRNGVGGSLAGIGRGRCGAGERG